MNLNKEGALEIAVEILKKTEVKVEKISDFYSYDKDLADIIYKFWENESEFFNELAEFTFKIKDRKESKDEI